MNKIVVAFSVLALSLAISASAFAGWDDGKGNPQGAPGGHGGQAFGVSERTHGANGNTDPSGVNGNQGKDGNTKNDTRGNAGGGGLPE